MANYADISPFYEWLDWLEKECSSYPQYQTLMFYEIRNKLDDLPEMIYCKDCKDHNRCEVEDLLIYFDPTVEHFCCHGERKDNVL